MSCTTLLVSTGTQLFISLLLAGQTSPQSVPVTLTTSISTGSTSISVSPLVLKISKGNRIVLTSAGVIVGGVIVSQDANAANTVIQTEPAIANYSSSLIARAYNLTEVLGGESVPFQFSAQAERTQYLSNDGWQGKFVSSQEFSFSWTGYIAINSQSAQGYRLLKRAWRSKQFVWVQRYLPNGEMIGGKVLVTNFSEQAQGGTYVKYDATFTGSGQPVMSDGYPTIG